MTKSLKKNMLKVLSKVNSGKIFTVRFLKNNGEIRTMNARCGVKKYASGGRLPYRPSEHNLISCFDLIKDDFRSFHLDQVIWIKVGKHTYVDAI